MKKLALFIGLLLCINSISAQQRGGQRVSIEERQKQELRSLKKHLNLDKAQEEKILNLQKTFANKVNTLRSENSQNAERGAMRKKMNTLRQQYDKDLMALLTDEQRVKYKKYSEKRQSQMQQRPEQRQRDGQRQKQGNGQSNRGNRF